MTEPISTFWLVGVFAVVAALWFFEERWVRKVTTKDPGFGRREDTLPQAIPSFNLRSLYRMLLVLLAIVLALRILRLY